MGTFLLWLAYITVEFFFWMMLGRLVLALLSLPLLLALRILLAPLPAPAG